MARRSLSGVAVFLALALVLGLPSGAAAGSHRGPRLVAFWLKASNGYGFVAWTDVAVQSGEGWISILLRGKHGLVSYGVPARVTRRTIDANLGRLGRISVSRVSTGRKKTVRRGCRGRVRKRVEAQRYEGTIEFHGEEGFTDVSATRAPLEYFPACYEDGGGGQKGDSQQGARLDVEKRRKDKLRIEFDAIQRRPGAKTAVSVEIAESRGRMSIQRVVWTWAGPHVLRYDNLLQTATVRPPAPYAGRATYRRDAPPAKQWTGNLTVDFPGRSGVHLTGRGFTATLEHPRR